MPGAHRRPPGASAGKSARWLAVLALLVIGLIAVIAGLIWFFRSGSALKWPVALLIPAVIQLVQGLAQGELALSWIGTSGVILFSWQIISDVTDHPGGGMAGFLVQAVSVVFLGIGFVLLARETHLGQKWKVLWARLAPGPGDNGPTSPG